MPRIVYYERPNGEKPVLDWLDSVEAQTPSAHRNILSKIDKLQSEGFRLISTDMLAPIKEHSNIFEIRGGRCRIIFYNDEKRDMFVLLWGFIKKQQKEKTQIETACRLAEEYVSTVEGGA